MTSTQEGHQMLDTELLTADQLAARLHVQPRTIREWARQGRIPLVQITAKVVRYDWQAVLTVLRGSRQEVRHD